MAKTTRQDHEPVACIRDIPNTHFTGRGYKSPFECPVCHRRVWQSLNYLGSRKLICDGAKLVKGTLEA